MEFSFNVNPLLPDEITIITSSFSNLQKFQRSSFDSHKNNLMQIIDNMGVASAKAQSLPQPITSFKRLQYSDHKLYVLKDPQANNMQGAVVGILKTGTKKLFVYDMLGKQHELEPLCVLDFYVHESRQRHGYGKLLFETMLRHERVEPVHLAVDRPSVKFAGFLKKHYGLKDCIPQMNNFVVFHGFFRDRPDSGAAGPRSKSGSGVGGRLSRPPVHPASPTKRPPSSSLQDRKSLLPTSRQTPRQSTPRQQRAVADVSRVDPRFDAPSEAAPAAASAQAILPAVHSAPVLAASRHHHPAAAAAAAPDRGHHHPQSAAPADDYDDGRRVAMATVGSPQQPQPPSGYASLGRPPSLNRGGHQQQLHQHLQHQQQLHQHLQLHPAAAAAGQLPGLNGAMQTRTRSHPNLANPGLYGGGGGGDFGFGSVPAKSRYFAPTTAAAAAAATLGGGGPYDYQQGLRRHYSHTRLW